MRLKGLRDIKTHGSLTQKGPTRIFSPTIASLHRELNLEKKVRLSQIQVIRDLLQEMQQAMAEGIPGAVHEFEQLTRRLTELEAE